MDQVMPTHYLGPGGKITNGNLTKETSSNHDKKAKKKWGIENDVHKISTIFLKHKVLKQNWRVLL